MQPCIQDKAIEILTTIMKETRETINLLNNKIDRIDDKIENIKDNMNDKIDNIKREILDDVKIIIENKWWICHWIKKNRINIFKVVWAIVIALLGSTSILDWQKILHF